MPITDEQLRQFTEEPLLGILATVNPDGSPQATPVWYSYDGRHFNTTAFADRIKVRNIRSNPRVSLVVVDTASYGDPLIVNGTAELVEEGVAEATLANAIRYAGEEGGRSSTAGLSAGGPRVIIRITPRKLIYGV